MSLRTLAVTFCVAAATVAASAAEVPAAPEPSLATDAGTPAPPAGDDGAAAAPDASQVVAAEAPDAGQVVAAAAPDAAQPGASAADTRDAQAEGRPGLSPEPAPPAAAADTAAAGPLLAVAAPIQASPALLEDPSTRWAVSFLMSAAFAAEYLAAAEAAALDPETGKAFQASPEASLLAARAHFAVAAAAARSQEIGYAADVRRALAARGLAPDAAPPALEAVTESLAASPHAPHWSALRQTFDGASPSCPLEPAEVIAYAGFQKKAQDERRTLTGAEILKRLDGWSAYKTRCLVFALMGASEGAKREMGFEPLHLMRALRQQGRGALDERALRSLMAVRLVEVSDYAEALRLIVELVDVEPAFRMPYEIVQRVYGLRQKGEGGVALRGM